MREISQDSCLQFYTVITAASSVYSWVTKHPKTEWPKRWFIISLFHTLRRPRAAKLGGMLQEVLGGYVEDVRYSPQKDWRMHRHCDSLLDCAAELHASGGLRIPKTRLLAGESSWVTDQEETTFLYWPGLTMAYHPHIIFHLVQVSPAGSSSHTSKEELGSTVRGKTVKEHIHSLHLIEDYVKRNFLLFFFFKSRE